MGQDLAAPNSDLDSEAKNLKTVKTHVVVCPFYFIDYTEIGPFYLIC